MCAHRRWLVWFWCPLQRAQCPRCQKFYGLGPQTRTMYSRKWYGQFQKHLYTERITLSEVTDLQLSTNLNNKRRTDDHDGELDTLFDLVPSTSSSKWHLLWGLWWGGWKWETVGCKANFEYLVLKLRCWLRTQARRATQLILQHNVFLPLSGDSWPLSYGRPLQHFAPCHALYKLCFPYFNTVLLRFCISFTTRKSRLVWTCRCWENQNQEEIFWTSKCLRPPRWNIRCSTGGMERWKRWWM